MLPNIHLIGIQGSGKGTQSARLVERFNFTYLAAGNMFRERAAVGDELGKAIGASMQAGRLLSVDYLLATIDSYLQANPPKTGVLGDGIMRTSEQFHALNRIWLEHDIDAPYLINLQLSEEQALERIEQRKKEQNNPARIGHHKQFSGKLLARTDDNPLAIHERFRIFHQLTEPVITIFKNQNRCVDIDGSKSVDDVAAEIHQHVLDWYPHLERYGTS